VKKKLKILIIILIVLFIIFLIALLSNKKEEKEQIQNIISNNTQDNIVSTKKFMKYVDIVSGNYYMKYVMPLENENGELEDCTAEVCVKGENIALNLYEKNLSVVKKDSKLYYIMHDQKLVTISSIKNGTSYNIDAYKINMSKKAIDNSFITTGMEKINDVKYYYEEYNANDDNETKLRYYFDGEDNLVYIKVISKDEPETITKIEEISSKTYDQMFEIPSQYSQTEL